MADKNARSDMRAFAHAHRTSPVFRKSLRAAARKQQKSNSK